MCSQRWGDAPVHSIAVSLFLNASQLHFFDPIGYQHDDWRHCPLDRATYDAGSCSCDYLKEFGERFKRSGKLQGLTCM